MGRLTQFDRSWILLTVGATLTFASLGHMWWGGIGVLLTGVAFIVLSFIALISAND